MDHRRVAAISRPVIAAVLLFFALARPAHAQWVVGGYFGAATTTRTYLMLTQTASHTAVRFDGVSYEGRSFNLPPYYGYRAAYFPKAPGWFGVEAEVLHMKVFALTGNGAGAGGTVNGVVVSGPVRIDSLVQRFALSHGQNMLLFNAVVRHAFGEAGAYRAARLIAVARAGVGPTLPHVESTIAGIGEERYERGAMGLQAAAGVELRMWTRLHAIAEYKFTRCRQSVDAAAGSHAETLLRSHHLAFGLAWQF